MNSNIHLTTTQSLKTTEEYEIMHDISYCEAIESLMYASLVTRLDISFSVTLLFKFINNSEDKH